MRMVDIIEKKRNGKELSEKEIRFFVYGYTDGTIPDYQAAALLMAVFFQGMNMEETVFLTQAMVDSGERVDLSTICGIKVDKHSTGGVGDKTTLVVAPIVSACGVPVAKMSGKGLGHTGGTIDKLESIPGFRTSLGIDEFLYNVKSIGIAVAGQTGNLAPADKKLYALRDVTATVNQISLIAASIMSKKIASGADAIVLDVKVGSGAFMKNIEDAKQLAGTMVSIGKGVGRSTVAVLTNMNQPLGFAIGNSLEVIEAIEALKGNGPEDLHRICIELAGKMVLLSGIANEKEAKLLVEESIRSGSALGKLKEMIGLQGGDTNVIYDYSMFPQAKYKTGYKAKEQGYVYSIDSEKLGLASMHLGAGREKKDDTIDYAAGIIINAKTGKKVGQGDSLCTLHYNDEEKLHESLKYLDDVFKIQSQKPEGSPLILEVCY